MRFSSTVSLHLCQAIRHALCEEKWEPFFVTVDDEFDEDHVTVRVLRLTNGARPNEEPREVRQFQFQSWRMYERVRVVYIFCAKLE